MRLRGNVFPDAQRRNNKICYDYLKNRTLERPQIHSHGDRGNE